jgi:hypothetical protein
MLNATPGELQSACGPDAETSGWHDRWGCCQPPNMHTPYAGTLPEDAVRPGGRSFVPDVSHSDNYRITID